MDIDSWVPKLKVCFRKHREILAVYAFGSMVKGTNFQSRELDLSSDLDLGILLDFRVRKERLWNWWEKLYREVGRRVPQELDLVILNDASLGLVHQILKTGKRIYEQPRRRHRREEAQLLIEALDFLPTKNWIEDRIVEHIKASRG